MKRLTCVLLILATLLPWRVALACAHEPALIQHRCCCQEAHPGHCPQTPDGIQGPCCNLVFSMAPAQVADEDTPAPPFRPDSKSPPGLAGDAAPCLAAAIPGGIARILQSSRPDWHSGRGIYLETARLRL